MIKVLLVFSLMIFPTFVQCQIQWTLSLQNQPNEYRNIPLSSYGMTTANYAAASSTNSSFELIQPLEIWKTFFNLQIRQIKSTSQLLRNGNSVQKSIVYSNYDDSTYLTIFFINADYIRGYIKIDINIEIRSSYHTLFQLVDPFSGILCYPDLSQSSIYLVQDSKISQEQTIDVYVSSLSVLPTQEEVIWYLILSKNMISLYHITRSTNKNVLVTQKEVNYQNFNYNYDILSNENGMILIRRHDNTLINAVFELYSFDQQNQQIFIKTVRASDQYQTGNIESVTFIQNTYYIVETFLYNHFLIQLTTLQQQYSYLVQEITTYLPIIIVFQSNFSFFISRDADQIVLVKLDGTVIGFSIETQLYLYITNIPVNSWDGEILSGEIIQFGEQIILFPFDENFQVLPSISFVPSIPSLRFNQTSNNQKYSISWSNGVAQTLSISSTQYSLNNPPFSINTQNVQLYVPFIGDSSDIFTIGYQGWIVGSNAVATSNMSGKNIQFEVSTSTLNKVDSLINLQSKKDIYSTCQDGIVIISPYISENGDQFYKYSYSAFTQTSPISLVEKTSFNSTSNENFKIDSSGSIVFYKNSLFTAYFLYLGEINSFVEFPVDCDIFSSNSQIQILATYCQYQLKTYFISYDASENKFLVQNYLFSLFSKDFIINIQVFSSGLIVISNNKTMILGFDAISQSYIGSANFATDNIPSDSTIYLFANSFIYASDSEVLQFSYNNFYNYEPSLYLRKLMGCCGIVNINQFSTQGIPVHNSDPNLEYLILPAKDQNQVDYLLIYKIEQTTAQDQLVTILNKPVAGTQLFTTNSYIGYYNQGLFNITLYGNYLELCDQVKYSIDPSYFNDNGKAVISGTLQVTQGGTNTKATSIQQSYYIYKDPSSQNAQFASNNQLSSLSTYFLNSPLSSTSTISFQDSKAFPSSNLFGWQIPTQLNQFGIVAQIIQRINIDLMQNQEYKSMIQILPNLAMYSFSRSISCGGTEFYTSDQDISVFFYIDDSYSSNKLQAYQVLVYAIIQPLNNITSYLIKANYSQNGSTITSVTTNSYFFRIDSYKIMSIITDPIIGWIIIARNYELTAQIKVLQIDQKSGIVSENDSAVVPTFPIISAYFDKVLKKTLFFTIEGKIYYFISSLSQPSSMNLQAAIIFSQVFIPDSQLTQATQLQNGDYLVQFNTSYLIKITLQYKNSRLDSVISTQLYIQSELMQFIGYAFINSANQVVIICQLNDIDSNPDYISYTLVLFEGSFIKSSVLFQQYGKTRTTFFVSTSSSIIQMSFFNVVYELTISDYVTITFYSVNLPKNFFGNAFGISPLYAPILPKNTVLFQAQIGKNNGNAFGSLMRPIIYSLVLLLIGLA